MLEEKIDLLNKQIAQLITLTEENLKVAIECKNNIAWNIPMADGNPPERGVVAEKPAKAKKEKKVTLTHEDMQEPEATPAVTIAAPVKEEPKVIEPDLFGDVAPAPAKVVDVEEVRKAIAALCLRDGNQNKAKEILNSFGFQKFNDMTPDKYADVLAATLKA